MLPSIMLFEVTRRARMLSTWVYMLVFFVLGFLLMCAAADVFRGASVNFGGAGKVMANSPYSVMQLVALLSYLATPVVAALMGNAVYQDVESNFFTLLYSYPLKKWTYLGGRYLGGVVVSFLVLCSIALGLFSASVMPFAAAERIGPHQVATYVLPYLVIVLPNMLFLGGVFFSLAALLRKMAPVYVTGVVLLLGYLIASSLMRDLEHRTLAGLLDPFGLGAIDDVTRYWTIQERNTQTIPLSGTLLYNRLIWGAVGLGALLWTGWRFRWDVSANTRARNVAPQGKPQVPVLTAPILQTQRRLFPMLVSIARLELRETINNVYFLVILLAGVLFVIVGATQMNQMYGTAVYPVTSLVLDVTTGSFGLATIVIIAFLAGDIGLS